MAHRDTDAGHLNHPDLQRIRIIPEMNLAPLARLGMSVFLGKPLLFTLGFDSGAINQQMQRARALPIRDGDVQTLLAA